MAPALSQIPEPTLAVENLSVRFGGEPVVTDVGLTVCPGEIAVIVGPSGSGKTTLIRAINRLNELYPNCQCAGTVRIRLDGRSVDVYQNSLPLPELRRKVAMVFQAPTVLPFSIEKNLRMPLQVTLGLAGAALTERVQWALQEVSLWDEVKDRLRDPANILSGGQQQRLCLARALALEPQVLLLDEPTASLDFRAAARIEQLLLELKERYTILAVSHSLRQTQRLADRVYVLREGRIIQEMDRRHLQDLETFQGLIEAAF